MRESVHVPVHLKQPIRYVMDLLWGITLPNSPDAETRIALAESG